MIIVEIDGFRGTIHQLIEGGHPFSNKLKQAYNRAVYCNPDGHAFTKAVLKHFGRGKILTPEPTPVPGRIY
jgi:hypothetical protein